MTKTYCHKNPGCDIHLIRQLGEGPESSQEGMECVDCSLSPDGTSFVLSGTWMQYPMTHHLRDHLVAGHKVPDHVFDVLDLEIHA